MDTLSKTGIAGKVLEEIKTIAEECNVEKVFLFGSRARGDYKDRSDIDIAFFGGDASKFSIRIDEETSTLLKFDIVDLQLPIQQELLQSINNEGIVIYEKV